MKLSAALGIFCLTGIAIGQVTEDEFDALQHSLQPTGKETWRTIPWEISILKAQKRAAQQQKLLFIWAMDGHPLGCT